MKVLFLSTGLVRIPCDKQGSPEGHITNLAKQLATLGHDVVIADRKYSSADKSESFEGCRISRLDAKYIAPNLMERITRARFLYLARTVFATFWLTYLTVKLVDEFEPDIIDTFSISSTVFLVAFGRRYRTKVVYNHHSSYWPTGGVSSWGSVAFGKFLLRHIGSVVTLNRRLTRWFTDLRAANVTLIPIGLNLPPFPVGQPKSSERIVLYVGRITREKGIEYLLKAFALTKSTLKLPIQLFLVGPFESAEDGRPGSYFHMLRMVISKNGLTGSVKFTGFISSGRLAEIFNESSIFVLPSIHENFAYASLEAMSHGLPVISSATDSGTDQVIEGWNGFLFQVGDWLTLSSRLTLILQNTSLMAEMGANARLFSEKFDLSIIAKKHVELFQTLLSQ